MKFLKLFILIVLLACEQSMEITAKNVFVDPDQFTRHLKFANDDILVNGSFYVDGVQYDNNIWVSFMKDQMYVSMMDLIGNTLEDSTDLSDLGKLYYYDMPMNDYGRFYVYDYSNYSPDPTPFDQNEIMTMRSEGSVNYYDFNYEFKHSFSDLQNNITELINVDESEPVNLEDDIRIELNKSLLVDGGSIKVTFVFRTDDYYINNNGREDYYGSASIYLKPTLELSEYVLSSEKLYELLEVAVKKYQRFLLREYSIMKGFDTGEVIYFSVGVRQFDYDYDKLSLVKRGTTTIKELDVIVSSFDYKSRQTEPYFFDFSEEDDDPVNEE